MALRGIVLEKKMVRGVMNSLVVDVLQSDKELPPQLFIRIQLDKYNEHNLGVQIGVNNSSARMTLIFPKFKDLIRFNMCQVNGAPPNAIRNALRFLVGSSAKLQETNKAGRLTLDPGTYFHMFCDHVRITLQEGRKLQAEAESMASSSSFNLERWMSDWLVAQFPRWSQEFDEIVERFDLIEILKKEPI